jgi:glucose-1-phosphate thymidylyltransferase
MNIEYATQPAPEGLAQAFVIGRPFIGKRRSALVLGDNIFFGHGLAEHLRSASANERGATVFGYWVRDPERYGVAAFDAHGRVTDLVEKPRLPKSNYAITGLYFYDEQVVDIARELKPSARGEYEITDVNRHYLALGQLDLVKLGRGTAWLDTGTHTSLLQASNFIQTIEERQGLKICWPEEIAYSQGWITGAELEALAHPVRKSGYGDYLLSLLETGRPT